MSDLEEDLLDDLDDLGSEGSGDGSDDEEGGFAAAGGEDSGEEEEAAAMDVTPESSMTQTLRKLAAANSLEEIAHVRKSAKFIRHMREIADVAAAPEREVVGTLESDRDYQLVVASNAFIQQIDEELQNIHRYVAELFSKKFVELETLVTNRLDYIRTVQRIGNETDMTTINLSDILPSALVMVTSVAGSTSNNKHLSERDLSECMRACEEALSLDADKTTILGFVESKMNKIAPNITNLIGSRVAAQLIGLAGGLDALTRIPACNIQVIGQEKKHLSGFSNAAAMPHTGILYYADPIQRCPPFIRRKALKMLAGKVALMARVDSYKNHNTGADGQRVRKEFDEAIDKLLEPAKARTKKALPIPEEKKRNKRGGKRVRRWKERFAMTELRQQQNRINVSLNDGEYGDSAMGITQGLIGSKNSGTLRAPPKKKVRLAKKQKVINASSGQTNGLSSSLVFTPVQGIELVNPNAQSDKVKEANKKWFSSNSGFLSAVPK
jgi:U4/U6 small nuclear ribonucleoprotein PRP31